MKKSVKAVIFDVGGVLAIGKYSKNKTHGHRMLGVHHYMSKKLGISLDQWFDSIDTSYAHSIEGKSSKTKVLEIFSKNLKTTPRKLEKLFLAAYRKNLKQNKALFKQAFKLKKRGYKIAILSDQWPISQKALMLPKYINKFDRVVVSCSPSVKMRKPNPKIYKLVLKKLNLNAAEAIFIDNQEWNIIPAQKLGMKTILFRNNKQLFKEPLWKELFNGD